MTSKGGKPKKERNESLQTQFLKAAFQPFTRIAERSIPSKQRDEVLSLFSQASEKRTDPPFAEGKLLEAMNMLPENPFIATRLVCFYRGIGKDWKALEMAQKAKNLAARKNINPDCLLE